MTWWRALNKARGSPGARFRGGFAAATLAVAACPAAMAQLGPVDARGYVEYRYLYHTGHDRDGAGAHGAALRTDLSTYVWRPWLVNAKGSLLVSEYASNANDGLATSSIVQGGLWLNLLARSRFPLTLFYEDFDAEYDSQPYQRFARTRTQGFRQQLSSKRYGTYSLEWRKGFTDALFADGISVPTRNDNKKWDLRGRKTFGRHSLSLVSRSLEVEAQEPDISTDSLRHTLRHSFRAGKRFDLQNTAFVTDEMRTSDFLVSDRVYRQLYSLATWRPDQANRLLVTARGLFQDGRSGQLANDQSEQSNMSLSGTASYRITERFSLTGALGGSRMENNTAGKANVSYQQLGASYASLGHPLLGGTYSYSGRTTIGNRSETETLESRSRREMKIDVGHGLGRVIQTRGGRRIDVRALQRVTTNHDSTGREINILRSTVYLTNSNESGQLSRYLRVSLTDQHTFGDERSVFQLLDVQYNLQGNVSRDNSWNLNASAQYGFRSHDKPAEFRNESASLAYSISAAYRHSYLFDLPHLNFSSDFQFQSEDFESDDPFDEDFEVDRQRLSASWRNRLEYRVGLLQLHADLNLNEVDGVWYASFRLNARRFFGMR